MAASKYLCSCKWTLHGNTLSWVPVGVPAVCVWQWCLPCPVGAAAARLPLCSPLPPGTHCSPA